MIERLGQPSDGGGTRKGPDVVIVGGCGRVGLPLGLAFAGRGLHVHLYDVNQQSVDQVNRGEPPFQEQGAAEALTDVVATGHLHASTRPACVAQAANVVVVLGTPVDEYLNPDPRAIPDSLQACAPYFADDQLLVLRSTVYPGVTARVERMLKELGREMPVAFCPERIAEGHAMTELFSLPQIVASRTEEGSRRASALFRELTPNIVELRPEEAELAKLFTNTWRYIKFATANQFFMIANDQGLDFERIRHALTFDYPRAQDMPGPGLAAGPCLFKDTMQLAAFNNNNFALGHAAMLVNEGLPLYLVARLELVYPLSTMTVGILGMAFKAGSDDTRSSLSYKLRRVLEFKARRVLCTDPYVTSDGRLLPLERVVADSDLLIVAAPHPEYRSLTAPVPVVDIWNLLGHGTQV